MLPGSPQERRTELHELHRRDYTNKSTIEAAKCWWDTKRRKYKANEFPSVEHDTYFTIHEIFQKHRPILKCIAVLFFFFFFCQRKNGIRPILAVTLKSKKDFSRGDWGHYTTEAGVRVSMGFKARRFPKHCFGTGRGRGRHASGGPQQGDSALVLPNKAEEGSILHKSGPLTKFIAWIKKERNH